MDKPSLTDTVEQARKWLTERLRAGEQQRCPVCTQHTKIYKRRVNAGMARRLILMHRFFGSEFGHVGNLPDRTHETAQLSWWGLIEEASDRREDGGRSGWWRVTEQGHLFARAALTIPKYALVYDSRLLGLDDSEQVGILDCLGAKFDYQELMDATPG